MIRSQHGSTVAKGTNIEGETTSIATFDQGEIGTLVGFYGVNTGDTLNNIGAIYSYPSCGNLIARNWLRFVILGVIILMILVCCVLCCRGRGKKGMVNTELAMTDRSAAGAEEGEKWGDKADANYSEGNSGKNIFDSKVEAKDKLDDM